MDGRDAQSFPLYDRFVSHPGQGPAADVRRITNVYRSAEAGYPSDQCELFDDFIQRDGHLRSALEGRVISVAGKSWIVAAGGSSDADRMAAEALEEALRLVPNFNETLVHLLKAVWYGYSLSEIVWERRGNLTVPTWFSNVPHVRIVFDDQDRPRLLTEQEQTKGVELAPGKWIYERMHGRLAATSGVMRTAAWLSYFKKLALRDWVVFSERFGMPYVEGKHAENATDEDKKVLKEAVQQIGKDGAAVYSRACEIVVKGIDGGGKADDVQGALSRFCDDEISELVTGSTLTSRGGGPGSYAQARVHQDRSFDFTLGDAERLAHRFEVDVGIPFVTYNGMSAKPPRLKIHVLRDTDPKTRAEVLKILQEMGLEIPAEQLRQEFQVKGAGAGGAVTPLPASPRRSVNPDSASLPC